MILSFLNAAILSLWLVITVSVMLTGGGSARQKNEGGYWDKETDRLRRQADQAGVSWNSRETKTIWIASLSVASLLYLTTGNLMLFGIGWLMLLFLPRQLIQNRKHKQRLGALTALTDCLRQLLARLPDQGSLSRAMEMVVENDSLGESTGVLREVLEELHLGSHVKDAVGLWRRRVGLKKFDHVAETLVQANADGWTPAALKALDKSVEALECDLRAVLLVAQKAASRKKQLYMTIATTWSFPLILSMMDTGQKNPYLYTVPGKLLIFAYVSVSLYTVVKGQEYLSLQVDEL